jgi:hypothetical protein
VFAHAGGKIPLVASRFAIVDEMNVILGAFSDPVLHMLRSVTGLGNVVLT